METKVEMAERHVRESQEHIDRQEAVLAELRRDGHDTAAAEELLATFRATLVQHQEGLRVLQLEERQDQSNPSGEYPCP